MRERGVRKRGARGGGRVDSDGRGVRKGRNKKKGDKWEKRKRIGDKGEGGMGEEG